MTSPFINPVPYDSWWRIESQGIIANALEAGADTPAIRLRVVSGWEPPFLLNVPRRVAGSAQAVLAWVQEQVTPRYAASRAPAPAAVPGTETVPADPLPDPLPASARTMISGPPGSHHQP